MAPSIVLGAVVVALAFASPAEGKRGQTFPAFIWGSGDYISHSKSGKGIQASYEVLSSSFLVDSIFGPLCSSEQQPSSSTGLDNAALVSDAHNLVSLFVLGNLRRDGFSQEAGESSLQKAVTAAPSALFLPNVEGLETGLLEAVNTKSDSLLRIGNCGPDSLAADSLASALSKHSGAVAGLLCEKEGDEGLATVEAELKAAGRPYIFVYAGQPDEATQRPTARALISTSAESKSLCSEKCMVQVRLFEALILIVVLLVALGAGMGMLHILDAPSKFEVEKKDTSRHQD